MKTEYKLTNGRILEILPDDDPESPREYDNLGSFFTWHNNWAPGGYIADRRHSLGDQLALAIRQQYHKDIDYAWRTKPRPELQSRMQKAAYAVPNPRNLAQYIDPLRDVAIIMPVYMYDHSGRTISLNPFSDPWDSGQVGFYFVTKGRLWSEYGYPLTKARREKAVKCLEAEIYTYNQYLTGDVWGYKVIDADGAEQDSCWGFYGEDLKTNGILDNLSEEDRALVLKEL